MKLTDLEPRFVKYESPTTHRFTDNLAEADGVMFFCPTCAKANGGPAGTHYILCWFVGRVPDDVDPKPGRWVPAGTTYSDLSFIGPAAASVLLRGGCNAHFFIRNGDIVGA